MLVRLPASVADQLGRVAQDGHRSVSETAATLIAAGLASVGRA